MPNVMVDRAAAELGSMMPVGVPLGTLGVLIGDLLGLLQQCFPDPTPDDVQSVLTEPPYGIVGLRRLLWQRQIKNAVAKCWKGDAAMLPYAQSAVLAKLRAGVSPHAVVSMLKGGHL